jgi:hypothetical protein
LPAAMPQCFRVFQLTYNYRYTFLCLLCAQKLHKIAIFTQALEAIFGSDLSDLRTTDVWKVDSYSQISLI